MIDPITEKPITASQAGKLLGVHRSTVEGWYRDNLLEWIVMGNRRYTSEAAIRRMVERQTEAAGAPVHFPETKSHRSKRHEESMKLCEKIFGVPFKGLPKQAK